MSNLDDIKPENLSQNDVVIAVMGPAGAGKSSFINHAAGQAGAKVGHKLECCTAEIRAFPCVHPSKHDGIRFVLVDTPPFDDMRTSEAGILDMIDQWLAKASKQGPRLAGIIYLHKICSNRIAGLTSPLQNLRMFSKLCGDGARCNVILATTMWDKVDPDTGLFREEELRSGYWKGMLAVGSRIERFGGKPESAWAIIDAILKGQIETRRLKKEFVDLKHQLSDSQTEIIELCDRLQKLLTKHRETLRSLRESVVSNDDDQLRNALDEEYDALQSRLQSTFEQVTNLKTSFGRRLFTLLGKKIWVMCML